MALQEAHAVKAGQKFSLAGITYTVNVVSSIRTPDEGIVKINAYTMIKQGVDTLQYGIDLVLPDSAPFITRN